MEIKTRFGFEEGSARRKKQTVRLVPVQHSYICIYLQLMITLYADKIWVSPLILLLQRIPIIIYFHFMSQTVKPYTVADPNGKIPLAGPRNICSKHCYDLRPRNLPFRPVSSTSTLQVRYFLWVRHILKGRAHFTNHTPSPAPIIIFCNLKTHNLCQKYLHV